MVWSIILLEDFSRSCCYFKKNELNALTVKAKQILS